MNEEIWCDIKNYEGLYQVSNKGRVKSLNYKCTGKEQILRPCKNTSGYLYVNFRKNGKRKMYTIHRLVLMTFNPVDGMENLEVNHLDENKENNNLSNLQWTTRKENINYGTHNARIAEKKSTPIVQLNLDGKYIRSYKSSREAEREGGYNQGHIINCCKGKRKTHRNYKWMYLSEYMDKYNGIID